MEKKVEPVVQNGQKDYNENFMPAVHRIGRFTMAIAFILSFLPVIYFYVVKKYTLPFSMYFNVILAITSIGIGMWLTEPLAYWPVLGSAGTYISYLSGNVGGMRFPVALSVQSAMKADINTPRGQVATIVGIVASVFTNLIILLIIVLTASWVLERLPQAVIASFAFVMPCLYGCMFMMRFMSGKKGFVFTFLSYLPYLLTSASTKLFILFLISPNANGIAIINNPKTAQSIKSYGTAVSVGLTVLVAYILFRMRKNKAEGQQA